MEEIELSEQCRLGNNRARKELYEQCEIATTSINSLNDIQ